MKVICKRKENRILALHLCSEFCPRSRRDISERQQMCRRRASRARCSGSIGLLQRHPEFFQRALFDARYIAARLM